MSQENIFYVYLHRKADNNDVFYVGKGCRQRATNKTNRNKWWIAVEAKHGFIVEYVEKGLSEEDAYDLEVETIKFYLECGYTLCNLSPGGAGGGAGIPKSVETRNKMSVAANSRKKPVINSEGDLFESVAAAVLWCKQQGYVKARPAYISDVCKGRNVSIYGVRWYHYTDDDQVPF